MTTSTDYTSFRSSEIDMAEAVKTIKKGGGVLFVSGKVWSIGIGLYSEKKLTQLIEQGIGPEAYKFEVLVNSPTMLKEYVEHLHPRLETLIEYHVQPLSILIEYPRDIPQAVYSSSYQAVFRVANDPFVKFLIQELDCPLITTFAFAEGGQIPKRMGSISSEILELVDYVARPNPNVETDNLLPVLIQLSDKEELEFLRE